jgi:hypothetical protein
MKSAKTSHFPHLAQSKLETPSNMLVAWVRFTTDSAMLPLSRPTIPLVAGTAVRFDIWSDHDLFVATGIRETETGAALGANGGASGSIEYLGGSPNGTSGPRGLAVAANSWTTLTFEFLNLSATPVFRFTGDGVVGPGADGEVSGPRLRRHRCQGTVTSTFGRHASRAG